jgi:hypothetical protein
MITNRNMSNKEIINKLIERTLTLSIEGYNSRDLERFISLKYEILSRMEKPEEIMTPKHEMWDDFCKILSYTLDNIEKCDAETLKQSEYILRHYFTTVDTEKSLEYFRSHGGFCDCEVLMNVDGK